MSCKSFLKNNLQYHLRRQGISEETSRSASRISLKRGKSTELKDKRGASRAAGENRFGPSGTANSSRPEGTHTQDQTHAPGLTTEEKMQVGSVCSIN